MNPNSQPGDQNSATFNYPAVGGTDVSQPVPMGVTQVASPNPVPLVTPTVLTPALSEGEGVQVQDVSLNGAPPSVQYPPTASSSPTPTVLTPAFSQGEGVNGVTQVANPLQSLADKLTNLKEEFIGESAEALPPTQTEPAPVLPPAPSQGGGENGEEVQVGPIVTDIASINPTVAPTPMPIVEEPKPSGKSLDEILKEETPNSDEKNEPVPGESYQYTIEQLLDLVVERDASDLHITVGYPVMIRVDGALQPVAEQIVTPEHASDLILPVLPEQKKELLEVNREVDLAYAHGEDARFRINAYYQKQTLAAAFRLIPSRIRSLDELKLPAIYHQIAKLKQGLVLVTGPTGSGKSTTLASILQEINLTRPDHLITIEDPIEYVFPKAMAMVDQREMHEDTHSWEIALKSALRQDPDVMLVGEMRDFETIAAAITLAETGHLVFATLHTNSASQTVDRIIDVFPEHQQPQIRAQLSHVIEAVIAQRLIPLPSGGRIAVSEIMLANPAVRNLIREAKTHQLDNVIRTSADIGMISLEASLVKLVRENVITMDLAQEYAVHPEEVVRLLKS